MKLSAIILMFTALLMLHCQNKSNDDQWMTEALQVADVVQHYHWENGHPPSSFNDIRDVVYRIRWEVPVDRSHVFTWRIIASTKSLYRQPYGCKLRVTYYNPSSGYRNDADIDYTTDPRNMWWDVYSFDDLDGKSVIADSERNLANQLATDVWDWRNDNKAWPRIDTKFAPWPIEGGPNALQPYQRFSFKVFRDQAGLEWIVIMPKKGRTEYWYPAEGPFSSRKCKEVRK